MPEGTEPLERAADEWYGRGRVTRITEYIGQAKLLGGGGKKLEISQVKV